MDETLIKKEPLGKNFFTYVSPHHTFGTDAILLANFAGGLREKAVDIGMGCGIIPLLMLRNGSVSTVTGVEISKEACDLAVRAKEEQCLENFNIINSDLLCLKGKIEFGCHTLVTCNPPYKAPGAGIKNPDKVLGVARHEIACTLEDIVRVSSKLLQTSGRFCICQRPERLAELMSLMREYKVEPKHLRLVSQRHGEEPWLVLIEGKKCAKTGLRIMPTLYIEENGNLSSEMLEIYGSYKEEYL